MTLRHFLNAAYAIFVEVYAATGKHLLEAIDLTNERFGIEKPPERVEADTDAQNMQSLQQLNAMMRGVS